MLAGPHARLPHTPLTPRREKPGRPPPSVSWIRRTTDRVVPPVHVDHVRDTKLRAVRRVLQGLRVHRVGRAVHESGRREVLGLDVGECETEAVWREFLRGLRARGVAGVRLCVSDAHPGLQAAIPYCETTTYSAAAR